MDAFSRPLFLRKIGDVVAAAKRHSVSKFPRLQANPPSAVASPPATSPTDANQQPLRETEIMLLVHQHTYKITK